MDLFAPLAGFFAQYNLQYVVPELVLSIFILGCVGHLAFSKTRNERQDTWVLAFFGVLSALCVLIAYWVIGAYDRVDTNVFFGMFRADLFSLLIRTLLTSGTLLVLCFSRIFFNKKADVPGEFYVILLSALLGGMMLSGSTDLIMLFVSLETLGISSYILAGYMRGNILSAEAGLKYLLYGGMATAVLLFGFSLLYGLTGSTAYSAIALAVPSFMMVNPLIIALMTIMIVAGISFKLSAAPFHMWAPDTYEGAPTPVVAFLSVISKIAAFSLALRLFLLLFPALPGWTPLISVLAVVSMVWGNVTALTQRNVKRLLAYSTVAHVGYLLLGLVVMTQEGLSSLVYYLITYLFMNLGAFAVVTHFENLTGRTDIAAYAGLVRKSPMMAFILSVMLLSLAGIPITAGFFGKFFLFQALVTAGQQYLWLVVVALLTSTVSLYYYLNVIRVMVIQEPSDAVAALPETAINQAEYTGGILGSGLAMAVALVGTLTLGIFCQDMLNLSGQAIKGLREPSGYALSTPMLKPILSQGRAAR